MKAQADSSSRGQKDLICREEKRKTAWRGMQGKLVVCGSGWRLGFIAFFCVLPEGGDVFQIQTGISWEEVSP
jgi:hypothetical protein